MSDTWRLETRKGQLSDIRWRDAPAPALGDGQARLRVSLFSFTANNVTYALMGEGMGYWDFFPAPEGWGVIPVWGFADVIETRSADAAIGERVYGYLPMASELIVDVARGTESSFVDAAAHRAKRASAYNQYVRTARDPLYRADQEAEQALFRPLFTTSFAIEDYLATADAFGAAQIVMSSASSKTAIATAYMLARAGGARPRVIGLTSSGNLDFVRRLGVYDEVLVYESHDAVDRSARTVFIDFAGDAALRARIHAHFGPALAHSLIVGATHWTAARAAAPPPDAEIAVRPTVFFAPDQIRIAIGQRGAAAFEGALAAAWRDFVRSAGSWLQVSIARDRPSAEAAYRDVLDGRTPAHVGHIISLQS